MDTVYEIRLSDIGEQSALDCGSKEKENNWRVLATASSNVLEHAHVSSEGAATQSPVIPRLEPSHSKMFGEKGALQRKS